MTHSQATAPAWLIAIVIFLCLIVVGLGVERYMDYKSSKEEYMRENWWSLPYSERDAWLEGMTELEKISWELRLPLYKK